MSELFKNYIAGQWVEGTSVNDNVNPSNTNDVVAKVPIGIGDRP